MPLVEIAGLRRVTVAFLGDGERDDADGRIRHPVDQLRGVLAGDDAIEQRANDAVFGAFGRAHSDGVEMILRGERVARIRTAQARADNAPTGGAGSKAIVDDDGLMRAMKSAEAKMHDPGRDARAVVGRAANGRRQPIEMGATKSHARLSLTLPLLDMVPVLGQCFGQLVRPIFQNWQAAGYTGATF